MNLRSMEEMVKLADAINNEIKKKEEGRKNKDFHDFKRYPRLISFEELCDIMSKEISDEKMSEILGIPKELLYTNKQNKIEDDESVNGNIYHSDEEWNKETFKHHKGSITPEEIKSAMEKIKQTDLDFGEIINDIIKESVENDDENDCCNCNCCCDDDKNNSDNHTNEKHEYFNNSTVLPMIVAEALTEYKKTLEAKRKTEVSETDNEIKKFTEWLNKISEEDSDYNPEPILKHSLEYFKKAKVDSDIDYTKKLREINAILNKYDFV